MAARATGQRGKGDFSVTSPAIVSRQDLPHSRPSFPGDAGMAARAIQPEGVTGVGKYDLIEGSDRRNHLDIQVERGRQVAHGRRNKRV